MKDLFDSASQKPILTVREKLLFVAKLTTIAPLRLAARLTILLLKAFRHNLSYRLYVICAGVHVSLSTFTGREIQYAYPSTRETYKSWIAGRKKNGPLKDELNSEIQTLKEGEAAICWLGDLEKAKKIVLFFHGGAYLSPAQQAHFEWCWNAYIVGGQEAGVPTAVAVVQYSLSPDAQYPTQLSEAAEALSEILRRGFQPKDIIIGGDSVGGNLTMQLICHIVNPHPDVRRIAIEHPFPAIFLVSPWLSCKMDSDSFKQNSNNDMLSKEIIRRYAKQNLGETGFVKAQASGNVWATPLDVDESFLQGIAAATKSLYVTVGKREVMHDQGAEIANLVKRIAPSVHVRLDSMDVEAHDFILVENWVKRPGHATKRMKDWFKTAISAE